MVKQARVLGQATAQLIQSIKGEAEKQQDSDLQRRLLAAAKTLADATAKMVEAARLCANNPHDVSYQDSLRRTAEDLRDVTIVAATTTPALRAKLVDRVQVCARRAVSTATQCISAAQSSHPHNNNVATREAFRSDTDELVSTIPPLVESIKASTVEPTDVNNQVELMYVAEVFLHPATHFVQSSRAVLPTVTDESVSKQLSETTQQLNTDLTELRSAISRAKPACQGLGLDVASQLIEDLQEELKEFERAVKNHSLRPLPGDNAETASQQLGYTSKLVNQGIAQLLSATSQGNEMYTSQAARDTAQNLKNLTSAVRAVAATSDDVDSQLDIIDAGKYVVIHSARLIKEAQRCLQDQTPIEQGATAVAKDITKALDRTIGCLPGQKDVDIAITCINEWTHGIDTNKFPPTDKTYGELQQELNTAAANLNEVSAEVVSSVRVPEQLASSSKDFSSAFHELLQVSMEMAGQTKDVQVQGQVVHSLKNVSTVSSNLLTTAKYVSVDPNLPNGRNQLQQAARAVTDSINSLVDVCTSSAPGQTECDNAIRNIQAMKPLLDNPSEPINDFSYYECWDSVKDKSKALGK